MNILAPEHQEGFELNIFGILKSFLVPQKAIQRQKHAALNELVIMRWIIHANLYDFGKLNLPLIVIIDKKRRIFVKENQIAGY
jgi:hypothetical protein